MVNKRTMPKVELPEASEKLYFVKRRGMKYEPEREAKPRRLKKTTKAREGEKLVKKTVKRVQYKQRGLTKVGEARQQAMAERELPFAIPSLAELAMAEKLKQKAIPPSERERLKAEEEVLKAQAKADVKKKIAEGAKAMGITEEQKSLMLLRTIFEDAGFADLPADIVDMVASQPSAEDKMLTLQLLVSEFKDMTPADIRARFPDEYGGAPPGYAPRARPDPRRMALEMADIADRLFPGDSRQIKNDFGALRRIFFDRGVDAGSQHRTNVKYLLKMSPADLRELADAVERGGVRTSADFPERIRELSRQKEERGMGLKFKKGRKVQGGALTMGDADAYLRRARVPRNIYHQAMSPVIEGEITDFDEFKRHVAMLMGEPRGGGFFDSIKSLVKKGVETAVEKVKENPIETAMKAFELAKKGKEMYGARQQKAEEDRQQRVREHIAKTWDSYKAGALPMTRVGKAK